MADVLDIKKTLKQWETQFRKEHGRKPNKIDIDSAPASIKETYLKYTKIKKCETSSEKNLLKDNSETERNTSRLLTPISPTENAVPKISDGRTDRTEEKFSNGKERERTEGNLERSPEVSLNTCDNNKDGNEQVEVWGSQFDRKVIKETEKTSVTKSTVSSSKPSYLKHLGQKMFQQSMKLDQLQKSKPKASLWKKPDTPRPKNPFIQETDPSKEGALKASVTSALADVDEVDGSVNPEIDKSANFGKVFEKALSISKHKVETKGLGSDSDVYLNKFQTKVKTKQSFLPSNLSNLISKHRQELDIEAELSETGETERDICDNNAMVEDDDDSKSSGHSWNVPVSKLIKDDENDFRRKSKRGGKKETKNEPVDETKEKSKRLGKGAGSVGNLKDKRDDDIDEHSFESMSEKGKRNKNCAIFGKKLGSRESEKNKLSDVAESKNKHCNNDNNVSEGEKMDTFEFNDDFEMKSLNKPARRIVKTAQKSKTLSESKKGSEESDENLRDIAREQADDSDSMDDTNVRKRKKTAKNQPTAKKRKTAVGDMAVGEADGNVGTSAVIRKPARAKPVSNDNFIRLNMKIKTYKRKGRHMTGSQYKRKMWKEKMQARSKSYGDACFKCGQSGHWANKCPGGQSKSHYDKEPVLDEDFPSMQEAAMLARGCQVEKPIKSTDVSQYQGESENIPPDVTSVEDDVDLEIQSGIVRTRPEAVAAPSAMKPLIDCEEGESLPETPELVLKGLRKFGFDHFRPGQEEAVMRILCGLSTLVVLSTGGGKSLCYQLPAYLYAQRSSCITLVVSPLVSLMEDQVTGLPNGVRGVCLHTNMTAHQRENVLEAVKSGKAQFLLVSPEAIAGGSMSLISSMSSLPPVAFACIDEAHCLSEWSHNFRPSYLRLCKVLQEKLGVQCFLGLTATATLSTASDVARHLKISDFRKATVRGSPIPANLILSVSRDEDREQALIGLLKGERFGTLDSIIVYCTRRDQTDKVATIIRTCMNTGAPAEMVTKGRGKRPKLEWDAESYHAGLTAAQRKRVQNAFMAGRLRVVVATVAFGMGLDKSDVRGIIHFNMPKSFESYVQEIGRAGRDGKQADCHVFLDPEVNDFTETSGPKLPDDFDVHTAKPIDYFWLLFSAEMFAEMARHTNSYARWKMDQSNSNDPYWTETTTPEVRALVGMEIMMGINQLPSSRMYWSKNKFIGNPGISEVMPCNRYMKLKQYFHVSDREAEPARGEPTYDRLYKVRPIIDHVSASFLENYELGREVAIDEAMVKFTGKLSFRQYMPAKPIKRGIKVWMACDSNSAYLSRFQVYLGRNGEGTEHGLGYNVVTSLTDNLHNTYRHIYFDNFFTSVPLMEDLLDSGLYACGTVRSNRKGFPADLKKPRVIRNRGDMLVLQKGNSNLTASVWKDKRLVHHLSTLSKPDEICQAQRRAGANILRVPQPSSVNAYNKYMGGVDQHDQLRMNYSVGRNSKKWWRYLFWFLVNCAIVNAFILFKQKSRRPRNKKRYTHIDFRIDVAMDLIAGYTNRKRRASEMNNVGLVDGANINGHINCKLNLPKGRCRYHLKHLGTRKETVYGCSVCRVHLCREGCHNLFHNL